MNGEYQIEIVLSTDNRHRDNIQATVIQQLTIEIKKEINCLYEYKSRYQIQTNKTNKIPVFKQ